MKGALVKLLQEKLLLMGLNPGPVDGEFGAGTRDAIIIFQSLRGMPPTGEATVETWQEIYKALGEIVSEDVDPGSQTSIIIDRASRTLILHVGGKFHKQYRVAVGKDETPTPLGDWLIVHRAKDWGTGFGTRWMGLNVPWGIYGIHGTNKPYSIGSYASHGCIRMFNESVEDLFPLTRNGTPVKIIDSRINWPPPLPSKDMKRGNNSQNVVFLQWRLKALGLPINGTGRFDTMTEWMIQYFQTKMCIPVTGRYDAATRRALELCNNRLYPVKAKRAAKGK